MSQDLQQLNWRFSRWTQLFRRRISTTSTYLDSARHESLSTSSLNAL